MWPVASYSTEPRQSKKKYKKISTNAKKQQLVSQFILVNSFRLWRSGPQKQRQKKKKTKKKTIKKKDVPGRGP